jgi:hypothetical protein
LAQGRGLDEVVSLRDGVHEGVFPIEVDERRDRAEVLVGVAPDVEPPRRIRVVRVHPGHAIAVEALEVQRALLVQRASQVGVSDRVELGRSGECRATSRDHENESERLHAHGLPPGTSNGLRAAAISRSLLASVGE